MKKKLLFVIPEYSHGGTNKSLENLLYFIDKSKYDVRIFSLYEDGGRLYKDIFAPYILRKSLLYHLAHDNKLTRKFMGALMKCSSKITFNWLYSYEINRLQHKNKFDSIIAYQEGLASEFVSLACVPVKKITWMHGCYSEGVGHSRESHDRRMYSKFDTIVSVSNAASESFLNIFPEFQDKCTYVYNFINTDTVQQKANESVGITIDSSRFNILSVGRFSKMKNFARIPEWAAVIRKQTSEPFCWYIIGDGEDFENTKQKIQEYDVNDYVKLLGAQDNPYPYFKEADLHVCASDFESFSYTIAESKVLHTPILCNIFPVAKEVVNSDVGIIAEKEQFPEIIVDIIENRNGCYSKLKEKIQNTDIDNLSIIEKINKLL